MKYFKFSAITILFALAVFIGCKRDASLLQQSDEALGVPPPKTKMAVPVVTCAEGSTQVSINLNVCAGATGAPAGFSIQWMTKAAFDANGGVWLASDDLALCKASFSGNANL